MQRTAKCPKRTNKSMGVKITARLPIEKMGYLLEWLATYQLPDFSHPGLICHIQPPSPVIARSVSAQQAAPSAALALPQNLV